MGVGIALFFAMVTLELAEAEVIWVEAAAPVRTRATTKARTIVFMNMAFILCYLS
jgi:hypothetical protein